MDNYADEHEQVEALKKWWRENGTAVITGVVIGVAVLIGARAWFKHRDTQAKEASVVYAQLMQSVTAGSADKVAKDSEQLEADYASTPYAALGALAAADVKVKAGDLKAAAQQLQWAVDHANQDGVRQIARLRLARVQLAAGDKDAALHTLEGAQPGGFAASYAEVKGDIYLAKGMTLQAREAYREALSLSAQDAPLRQLLQMKLDELGGAAAPKGSNS